MNITMTGSCQDAEFKGHKKDIQKCIQLLATHFGLAVKPCLLRPQQDPGDPLSEGSPASQSDTAPCHGHHPCLQIPTHHTINIKKKKKTLKPLKVCEIKTDCLPGFHVCRVSFFSFFPRLSIVYQIPNFWSFLLVIIIILTNICLPLMCLYL